MNPHNLLTALDPPRDSPPRRWRCNYCGAKGLWDDVNAIECAHVYPPCKWCGQTPTCASDCAGIALALSAPGVRVVGPVAVATGLLIGATVDES